jgi:hypothetical protein
MRRSAVAIHPGATLVNEGIAPTPFLPLLAYFYWTSIIRGRAGSRPRQSLHLDRGVCGLYERLADR